MSTSATATAAPEITIDVVATDEGDWLLCRLCPDAKFLPLDASQGAWKRTSQWIARHQRGEHLAPRTCAGTD